MVPDKLSHCFNIFSVLQSELLFFWMSSSTCFHDFLIFLVDLFFLSPTVSDKVAAGGTRCGGLLKRVLVEAFTSAIFLSTERDV